MMKKRILSAILAGGMALTLLPTVACAAPETDTVVYAAAASYTADNATLVTFSSSGVTATGRYSGYTTQGSALTITAAGTYVISGSSASGTIAVEKDVTDVTIVLNGLSLTSSATAPMLLGKNSEATLLVQAGSENSLTDATANDESAVVKVKSGADLTIMGSGALHVTGKAKNGIKGGAESTLTIGETALTVDAVDNAIACDHELTINSGTLTLTAGGDAIKASPDVEEGDTVSKGNIALHGGTFVIDAACDAVQADGDLTVSGGSYRITTNSGSKTVLSEDADSCKGLKADGTLTVSGGTFTMDCADDTLHADNVTVSGGTLTLSSGDDAVHADNVLTIGTRGSKTGPTVSIPTANEGLEGTKVLVYGGTVDLTTADDGINAANSDIGDRSEQFSIEIYGGTLQVNANGDGLDSNGSILMEGGTVEVVGPSNSANAAIDYEYSFTQNGGTLLAIGASGMAMTPSAGTQAYVSFGAGGMGAGGHGGGMGGMGGMRPTDGTMPDGTTRPARPNDMDATPDAVSGATAQAGNTPPDVGNQGTPPTDRENMEMPDDMGGAATGGLNIAVGDTLTIQNSSGKTLYEYKAEKAAGNVVFSSAELVEGETYTLLQNGTEAASTTAAFGTGGNTGGMGGMGNAAGMAFADVPSSAWYAEAVQFARRSGLMNGTDDTHFSPETGMTRAMLATVLYRMSGATAAEQTAAFADVPADAWYAEAVAWAAEQGIVTGTSASTFSPEQTVTREQLAAMLYRYAGGTAGTTSLAAYADAAQISAYARDGLTWCVDKGIVTGTDANRLAPQASATRAEVAAMLMRYQQSTQTQTV